jgi:hypothetical protein
MSIINPTGRSSLPPLPADRALVPIQRAPTNISSVAALVAAGPATGTAGFLAQQIAQERLEDGLHLPRWRERASAYAGAAPSRSGRLVIAA